MKAYSVSRATAVDQKPIRDLIREARINPLSLKWHRFLVVKDEDGALIGCGQLKPRRDGSIELASIAVQRRYRKQGVARLIIEALLAQHDGPLWLKCADVLIPFYEKFGFVEATDTRKMPPHFRFAYRAGKLFTWLMRSEQGFAVMVRETKIRNTEGHGEGQPAAVEGREEKKYKISVSLGDRRSPISAVLRVPKFC